MHNYTVADGLPSNTVYCVYKDSKGILWFATDKGIARYNGIKFEKFSTADGLSDNEIFCFGEDKYHRLWMGTFNGSLCYYKDGVIHTQANTPFLKQPPGKSFITNIYNEYDGSVTFRFHRSDYFLNITGEKIDVIKLPGQKLDILHLVQIAKSTPTKYHLTFVLRTMDWDTSGQFSALRRTTKAHGAVISNNQRYVVYDSAIVSGNRTVFPNPPNLDSLRIQCVFEDKQRNLVLMATSTGLFLLPSRQQIFKGYEVSHVTKDDQGNYWVSTTDAGVFCINTEYRHFRAFTHPTDRSVVRYARIVNGQLYFGTKNGNVYVLRNDTIQTLFNIAAYRREYAQKHPFTDYVNLDSSKPRILRFSATDQQALQSQIFATAFYVDDSLHFYYATVWETCIFDHLQGNRARVAQSIPMLFSGVYKNIAVTKNAIYLHSQTEVFYIPKTVMKDHDYSQLKKLTPHPETSERLYGWATDEAGNMWCTTVDSLYKVGSDKLIVQPEFGAIRLRRFGFWNGFLMGYKPDNTLVICHLDNKKLITDTAINGSSIWTNFYQINATQILISTNDKYRIATLTHPGQPGGFKIQTVESRFIPVQSEYVCSDSNVTYFFNNGTITRFDTKRLFNTSSKPVVYLISLRTKDSSYATTNSISIPYQQAGNIQLSYLPMSFEGGDLHCEYSVSEDNGNTWRATDDGNIGLYLPHYGTYYLRIRAKTSSDIYSDIATLQFTILKPFWATWWFILLAGIVTLAVIWWIILLIARGMLRQKQKAYDADMKYQRMEFKALNALMNPHFIFNTLNNIQNLFKNNGNRADEYFVTFARLIRQNMQNVTKDTISLEQELNLVANYLKLEKLRFDEFVNYKMDVDPELDLDNVFIPPLLIQPLVENSIRHGLLPKQSTDNFVTVHVYEKGKSLFIDVEDNGVGLSGKTSHIDPLHESLGLSNLRKRIEHMNRIRTEVISFDLTELKDDKGHVKGTLARIEIASDRW